MYLHEIANFFLVLNTMPPSDRSQFHSSLAHHLPAEAHLGCFQVWVIMNKAFITFCMGLVFFFVDTTFQLLWVNTKERDCWMVC